MEEKKHSLGSASSALPQVIAMHLPQFHPIPENDQWWGRGFTEWTNVAKCTSRFPGHYQPHLPSDLGFYDLRLPEARAAQAELASAYGIGGFCYYHYWFNGRRILQRPVSEILASGEPDFPFCLCWANENWTRRWDGLDEQVLLKQDYSDKDDLDHIHHLIRSFEDPRYIRFDDKPVFLVYRTTNLPNPERTANLWRDAVNKAGFKGLHLGMVQGFRSERINPTSVGFDFGMEFAPDWYELQPHVDPRSPATFWQRICGLRQPQFQDIAVKYDNLRNNMLAKPLPDYPFYRCVTPGWDNSARRVTGATILVDSTPDSYEFWLKAVVKEAISGNREFVFINAWNEWAEGNHLEPCQRWGRKYLEATKRAIAQ